MRRPLIWMLGLLLTQAAFTCEKSDEPEPEPEQYCSTPATVRNLTGLDGCGFVLELDNGQRLEPAGPEWQNFNKSDGMRVSISYVEEARGSICMVGKTVRLSCIRSIDWCGTPSPSSK